MSFKKTQSYLLALGAALTMLHCGEASQTDFAAGTPGGGGGDGASATRSLDDFEECDIDSACEDGFVCRGFCIPEVDDEGAFGGPCHADQSCGGELACHQGVCVDSELLDQYYASLEQSEAEFFGGAPEVLHETRAQELTPIGSPAANTRSAIDLTTTGFVPRAGNQRSHGSCLAFAAGYGMASYIEAQQNGRNISNSSGNSRDIMSPAYLYNTARRVGGRCGQDGTYYSSIRDALRQYGIPSAATFPYRNSLLRSCSIELSSQGRQEALANRITRTQRLFAVDPRGSLERRLIGSSQINSIKSQLAQGRPVVIAIRTPRQMQRMWRGSAHLDLPISPYQRPSGEISHGYHAVLIVGYDDARQTFKIMNSWGRTWGDQGMMTMSYRAAQYTLYEAWVAHESTTSVDPPPQPSGCSSPVTTCNASQDAVVRECADGQTQVMRRCSSDESCVIDGNGAYCTQVSGRCAGDLDQACGRSRDGSTYYVVETCDGAYLDTLEQCAGQCARDGSRRPYCVDSNPDPEPSPDPDPDPGSGEPLEVRIEWVANADLDLSLTEPGIGTYSYQGTPRGATGRFDNNSSCRNGNRFCRTDVPSIERVIWSDQPPRGDLSVVIENYNSPSSVPARLVILRDGRVSSATDLNIPGGAGSQTRPITIRLR